MKHSKVEKLKVAIGKRLRSYRKSIGLNVVDFSGKIKISQGTLSEQENGISAPSAYTLANLCQYTDVDIVWLLTGKGNKN